MFHHQAVWPDSFWPMALLGAFNGQVSSRNHTFDHFDAKNNISSHFKSKHEQYLLLTTCRVAFFDFPEPGSENNKGPHQLSVSP